MSIFSTVTLLQMAFSIPKPELCSPPAHQVILESSSIYPGRMKGSDCGARLALPRPPLRMLHLIVVVVAVSFSQRIFRYAFTVFRNCFGSKGPSFCFFLFARAMITCCNYLFLKRLHLMRLQLEICLSCFFRGGSSAGERTIRFMVPMTPPELLLPPTPCTSER